MMPPPKQPAPGSTHPKPVTAGIFKLARADLEGMLEAADELKLARFHVNLRDARNIPGFIRAMKRDLGYPEWFGNNLDALNDCLTDFSWHPAPGYVILLDGLSSLSATPTSFAAFNQVLASAVEEWKLRDVPFWVFYLTDDQESATSAPPGPRA